MTHVTHLLAEHALSIDAGRIDPGVTQIALLAVLDLMGAAVAGSGSTAPLAALGISERLYGSGTAPAWFTGQKHALLAALLHNGLCAAALDLDDGNRSARGHPGASVIPTVLTLAAVSPGVSGTDILSAIIAGYDVGVRIAAAQRPELIPTRQSGRWAAFAAAAAAGRLLKIPPDRLAEALAIAGVLAPNQQANGSSGFARVTGNLVKEGIAFSAQTGVQALHLAAHGFTGPIDLLDHDTVYDQQRIFKALGQAFEISDTYFKPYACCRYIHPALDAFSALRQAHAFAACDIGSIEVATFDFALRLANSAQPDNLVALQYSLPYCLATLVLYGDAALAPVSPALLDRPDIVTLARTIVLSRDPVAEACFPTQTLARVTIMLNSGDRLVSNLTVPRGDPARPMDGEALLDKFRSVTAARLSRQEQAALVRSVDLLGTGDAQCLLAILER